MANFVDELANLIIGDGPVVIDEDGNETDLAIFGISDDESKKSRKSNRDIKNSSLTETTKEIDGQTYKLDFSACLNNLENDRKNGKAKKMTEVKPVVAISSEESDSSGPIPRKNPAQKKKTRIIQSSSDEDAPKDSVVNSIRTRPATPPPTRNRRQIVLTDSADSTDSVPQIKLPKLKNKRTLTIPAIDKLQDDDIQIVDSMMEFDSNEALIDGIPKKQSSRDIILGKSKHNANSRTVIDKPMEVDYVEPKLPRFKKKKPTRNVEVVDQSVIPLKEPEIQATIPETPTVNKPITKQNTKMGCLDTLAKMEESSEDNILQGWVSENSQSELVASSSRTRLDGPNRSKRFSKDFQASSKRPRGENRHQDYDAFSKSIRSPDKNSNKSDAFVSTISNKVRFDGGRHPKQRSKTEKENYEKRYGSKRFRTRDSSPNAIIEILSSTEKKSKNLSLRSQSRHENIMIVSDSE